ncbi:MAG: insulinase family protein, partial [Christensenellaceae bacterium]|nr:insulinase family protein [Christensenellaceae bacterium]
QKIREEMGMAYSVYSYSSAYTDAGMFTLYGGTSQENAEEVTKLMLAECRDIAENGISDEEFERSKAQLRGGFILSTESGQAIMNSIGKAAVMGKGLVTEDMLLAKLENVDKETVREVAKEVFGSGIVSAVYVGKGGKELEKLFI